MSEWREGMNEYETLVWQIQHYWHYASKEGSRLPHELRAKRTELAGNTQLQSDDKARLLRLADQRIAQEESRINGELDRMRGGGGE